MAPGDRMVKRRKVACCLERDGSFLFTFRTDGTPPNVTFLIPAGGGIEPGEDPIAAAAREAHEELGVVIADWHPLGVLTDEFEFRACTWRETVHVFGARLAREVDVGAFGRESDGRVLPLRWLTVAEAARSPHPVLPPGLVGLIANFVRDAGTG